MPFIQKTQSRCPASLPHELVLEGPRLLLKPVRIEDATDLSELLSDAKTMQHLIGMAKLPKGWLIRDSEDRIEEHIRLQGRGQRLSFHVYLKSEDGTERRKLVGCAGLHNVELYNHKSDLGVILHHELWSNLYGTECLFLILKYGFEELHLHRMVFETGVDNKPMRTWLEKVGKSKLEFQKKDVVYENGAYTDLCGYPIFDNEWYTGTKSNLIQYLKRAIDHESLSKFIN